MIEDDENLLELAQVALRRAGYDVLSAADGEAAADLILHEAPDLVLLDLMLPGCDGFEPLERLADVSRHTPAGTPCRVVVRRAHEGIVLTVEDEGPGVPDDHKASIFDPFQRGETRDHSPGTGIGLSLVAKFAELHDGRAWMEDRPGGGASFHVLVSDG